MHKSTDSLRLPRFRAAALIHSRTRTRFLAQGHEIQRFHATCTIPCACHAKLCPATQQVTPFPTPATCNARAATSKCTIHHSCHVNPPPSVLPHAHVHPESHACHATRSSAILFTHPPPFPTPATRNAIPRSSAARTLPPFPTPATRNVHTRARRHARDTLNCSAQ